MTARIEVSPLTGRIYRGRVNAAGTAFVGEKQDVTSDVLRAVLSKANYHGGTFEVSDGTKTWTVTVSEEPNTEAERAAEAQGRTP